MSTVPLTSLFTHTTNAFEEACSKTPVVAQLLRLEDRKNLLISAIRQITSTDCCTDSDAAAKPTITCSLKAERNRTGHWSLFVDNDGKGYGSREESEVVTLYDENGVIFAISDDETPSMHPIKAGESVDASDLRYIPLRGTGHQYRFLCPEDSDQARDRHKEFKKSVVDTAYGSLSWIADGSEDLEPLKEDASKYFRKSFYQGFKAVEDDFLKKARSPPLSSESSQRSMAVRCSAGVMPLLDGGQALVAVYAISKPDEPGKRYASSAKSKSPLAYLPGVQVRKLLPSRSATSVTIRVPVERAADNIDEDWRNDDSDLSSVPASEVEDREERYQAQVDHASANVGPLANMKFRFCKSFETNGERHRAISCDYQILSTSCDTRPDEMEATMSMKSFRAATRAALTDQAKIDWDSIKRKYTANNRPNNFWSMRGGKAVFDSHHDKGCADALASLNRYLDRTSWNEDDLHDFELQIGHHYIHGKAGKPWEPGFTYKGWQMRRGGKIIASSVDDEEHGVNTIPPRPPKDPKPAIPNA